MKNRKIFFYESEFIVHYKVFYPRPETEQLVDLTIKNFINLFPNKKRILEIGIGSGVISISLFKKNKNLEIDSVDISDKALKNTEENSRLLGTKLNIYKSNMFENVKDKFDLIISNLPYIETTFKVSKEIKEWDPEIALFAGKDGLDCFRLFFKDVKKYLKKNFLIALEIGWEQKELLTFLIKKEFKNFKYEFKKDYQKKDRFLFIYNL